MPSRRHVRQHHRLLLSSLAPELRQKCIVSRHAKLAEDIYETVLEIPAPVTNLWHIVAVLADIEPVALHRCPGAGGFLFNLAAEPRDTQNGVQSELIAVKIIEDDHVEGGCGCALLFIAAHMNIVMIVPPVSQLVNE